jgi:DNA polymerase III gamma/tau subunit
MTTELYKELRPTEFRQVYGQSAACATLQSFVVNNRVPHAILFSGPSGCGKTTLARILRTELGCGDSDFCEINAADFRGIDTIRDIGRRMGMSPLTGKVKVWLIDEAHQLSTQAQNAFLKMLEDTPKHVYFMLATTDPNKLLKTIRTRCTDVPVRSLTDGVLRQLVVDSANDEVVDAIVKHSDGSARRSLVILDAIADLEDIDDQLKAVASMDTEREAIELCKLLIHPKGTFREVAALLKSDGWNHDPENVRRLVLGYFNTVLLGGGKNAGRARHVIDCFAAPYYDTGKAGLTASCFDVFHSG